MDFDVKQAQELLEISKLPWAYETALYQGDSHDEAISGLRQTIDQRQQMKMHRHENVAAVVVFDSDSNKITVSFDPTGDSADKMDNLKFWKKEHDLGGQVHSGFQNAIFKEGEGGALIDAVKQTVVDYAAQSGGDVDLNITGFSKGGTMAVAAAAQWMAEGLEQTNPNIQMQQLMTFASPPLGDDLFSARFDDKARQMGVNITRVIGGDDIVPTVMTKNGSRFMGGDRFTHVGTSVYVKAQNEAHNETEIIVNPSQEDINDMRKSAPQKGGWHNPNVYTQALANVTKVTDVRIGGTDVAYEDLSIYQAPPIKPK